LLSKAIVVIMLCAVIAVYAILPYINGMTGPYRVVTYTVKKVVVPERNDDWKDRPIRDGKGNVVK
jgi:hypothetical protein